jgi:hypothetical protein
MGSLITTEYAALNRQHHQDRSYFGAGANHYVDIVRELSEMLGTRDILDYGCGKGVLAQLLGWTIKEYDPAIPEKSAPAIPADIVVCVSVLEHVETECLDVVLEDLRRVTLKAGFFVIPHNPAVDTLADGRNAHATVENLGWWENKLSQRFQIHSRAQMSSLTCNDGHGVMIGSRTFFLLT